MLLETMPNLAPGFRRTFLLLYGRQEGLAVPSDTLAVEDPEDDFEDDDDAEHDDWYDDDDYEDEDDEAYEEEDDED